MSHTKLALIVNILPNDHTEEINDQMDKTDYNWDNTFKVLQVGID